jgi:hypothetical protein
MSDFIIPGRYDFSIPQAQRLSDLAGIDADLDSVVRMTIRCEKIGRQLLTNPATASPSLDWQEDLLALGDLMFAAVVRYGRTLGTGVRMGIPKVWIESLPERLRESHEYFKALRDKYIAHSVNALEDNQVFLLLSPQLPNDANQRPHSISVDRGSLVGLARSDLVDLRELATVLKSRVGSEIQKETEKLLELAKAMPLEEIKRRGSESSPIPGKGDTFKGRKSF